MKTKNIVVIALVSVLVLVFGVSGFLLFRGISQFSAAEKSLKRSVSTFRNYYGRNPFPSPENVEKEQDNGQVLRRWLASLSLSLREGQVGPIQKTPSNFVRLFSKTREALKSLADEHHAVLPENFAFGFERYSASGALPAPMDVPRLAQQLIITDHLCRIFFESGIAGITSLRREDFESAGNTTAAPKARPTRGRARRASTAVSASSGGGRIWDVQRDAGELKEKALYARLRFGVTFEAREKVLMQIMNQLAAHDMFAVVTLLQIEKATDDVVAPTASKADAETDLMAAEAEHPSRSQRMMSGTALEQPMRISMEIDVYRFAELTSGKGA